MTLDEIAAELINNFEKGLVDDHIDDEGKQVMISSLAEVLHTVYEPYDTEIIRLKAALTKTRSALAELMLSLNGLHIDKEHPVWDAFRNAKETLGA